ncbi:MAG: lysophospholipid acyltransferase family protein [Proteobacteria bacterium]|nr:lysophospholipid acyltransferase family protein [Pseudomonadota bacterium]
MKFLSKEKKRALIIRFLPNILSKFQKLLFKTISWKTEGLEEGNKIETPVIIAFFHGRMMMLPFFYKLLRPNRKIKMIVSSHFDGDLVGKIVSYHGIGTLKGSSTRGGVKLLKEIIGLKDFDIGITPDGPKGPAEKVKDGVIFISKLTGFPILPVTYSVKKKKILNTWDSFIVPKPFTKGLFICGEPIYVPKDISDEKFKYMSQMLEDRLKGLNTLADELVKKI